MGVSIQYAKSVGVIQNRHQGFNLKSHQAARKLYISKIQPFLAASNHTRLVSILT